MRQILQSLRTGDLEVAEVPCPRLAPGGLLVRTTRTLISAGTERMLLDFGRANLLQKACQQPDKVRMVRDKIRTDGLLPTLAAVRDKLDQPLATGYCNTGVVLEVGEKVNGFQVGDRVVSNGKHSEVVCVPANLTARVPDGVEDDAAVFTVAGAIALQGIRLANPTLGECVVVVGLGLIGQLAVQLLLANGCRVMGIDFDGRKLEMARRHGAQVARIGEGADPVEAGVHFSRGRGVDAVLVTASTRSAEPIHQAAKMSRKRGRIVLVGVTGLELSRDDFYEKELTFQVSCSYGPGRYDTAYEEGGHDYPVGFVRWTEQRNFEAVLDAMGRGQLDASSLVTHRFPLQEATKAYDVLTGDPTCLGILLDYPVTPGAEEEARTPIIALTTGAPRQCIDRTTVAFLGAGNHATRTLVPAFREGGARLYAIASAAGVSGLHAGRRYGFEQTTTDSDSLLHDGQVEAVVVSTRHDSHAGYVVKALRAGKHVFVEKPLCLSLGELEHIEEAYTKSRVVSGDGVRGDSRPLLMVGFNRRFARHVQKMRTLLADVVEPKAFVMTVNAGAIAADHWTQDPDVGGGRLIGEACHFIDLMRFLAGSPIVSRSRLTMASVCGDTASLQLGFGDGSIGTVHYLANGNQVIPKERLEVFTAGRVLQLDNFRRLTGCGWSGFRRDRLWRQDKGHAACAAAFLRAVEEQAPPPIAVEEIFEVTRETIQIATSPAA
jgi:predicted dehydrogenase/threonine dehydrogenase-like Zn-dependent dehydrogenase